MAFSRLLYASLAHSSCRLDLARGYDYGKVATLLSSILKLEKCLLWGISSAHLQSIAGKRISLLASWAFLMKLYMSAQPPPCSGPHEQFFKPLVVQMPDRRRFLGFRKGGWGPGYSTRASPGECCWETVCFHQVSPQLLVPWPPPL